MLRKMTAGMFPDAILSEHGSEIVNPMKLLTVIEYIINLVLL